MQKDGLEQTALCSALESLGREGTFQMKKLRGAISLMLALQLCGLTAKAGPGVGST